MVQEKRRQVSVALALVSLVAWQVFWLARPINLAAADIGRHLTNGRLLLTAWREHGSGVLTTNHYSYVNPDFPFLNHHYGSGVLFYVLERSVGWVGLHIVFISINVLALVLFFAASRQAATLPTVWLAGIVLMPFIGARAEVRPEAFSYFFAGLFWLLLAAYNRGRLRREALLVLPLTQVVWVNLHVYFFVGLILAAVYFIPSLAVAWRQRRVAFYSEARWRVLILMLLVLASTLNPAGVRVLLYPLSVASNYGYPIVENQSVPWLTQWGMAWPNFQFLYVLGGLLLGLTLWRGRRWRLVSAELVLAAGSWVAAYTAVRNFALFGFFAWPWLATGLTAAAEDMAGSWPRSQRRQGALLVVLVALVSVYFQQFEAIRRQWQTLGLGLADGVNGAATYITAHRLPGPLFNNYDNGGYLIYHLFPRERVFVDNRPEAYPEAFFREVYIPLQQDERVWREQLERWQFRLIVFYRHDLTDWGQRFLTARARDPDWQVVFADDYHFVFVRSDENPAP